MASNDDTLDDGDGNSSDWIELFNASAETVDLAGYRLANAPSGGSAWTFPSYTLEPGAFALVFASGQKTDDYVDAAGNLHADFTLPADGGYLALVAPNGTVLTEFGSVDQKYPRHLSDVSYGVSQSQTIIDPTSPSRYTVPLDDSFDNDWTLPGFDADAHGFAAGTAAIGYESSPDDRTNFVGQFTTELPDRTHGVYARMEFDLGDASAVTALLLRLKYDNGFVAYLNGQKVAEDNAPPVLGWFSPAPESGRRDSEVLENYVAFDLSRHVDKLVDGTNVLGIHGLNYLPDNSDMLLVADLEAAASDPLAAFGAAGKIGYMTTPTPGAPNVSDADVRSGFVADTRFSVDRGFFTEPFTVEIASGTPGARIRYTVDGTPPTETHGDVYSGPITVAATTTLRAAAFKDDFIATNVDTHTYLFLSDVLTQPFLPEGFPAEWANMPADYGMDPDVIGPNDLFGGRYRNSIISDLMSLPTLSLVFDPDHMFGREGLYQNPTATGDRWERPVSVEFMSPDGSEDGFHVNSGIRIMGGSSRQPDIPKHSFRLEFREQYGEGKLVYPLFNDQPFGEDATDSFDELVVRTGFNNSWMHRHYYQGFRGEQPRDQWVRDLQLATGHLSPRGRFVHVYLNGMYWGIYNIQERPAAPYMQQYFGGDKDGGWDVINSGDAIDGDTRAWRDLIALANAGVRSAEQYAAIEQRLDVVNLIDYMILNFYIGNTDWDGHNWIAARQRSDDGRFRLYAWDSEFAISLPPSNTAVGESAERQIINTNQTGVSGANVPSNLHSRLSQYAEYRLLFADRVHEHFFNDGVLTPEQATRIFLDRSDQIDRAVVAESARWGDYRRDVSPGRWRSDQFDLFHRDEHYVAQRDFIVDRYLPVRTGIVLEQLRRRRLYPDTAAPSFNRHGGAVPSNFVLEMSAGENAVVYYTVDGTDPRDAATDRPSGSALTYQAPLPLSESQTVKARARRDGEWSALTEATFFVSSADSTNLRITEINFNPYPPTAEELQAHPDLDNDDFEFIEIQNISVAPISLAGARFDDGVGFTFPFVELAPDEYAVVAKNAEAFELRYGTDVHPLGQYNGSLRNSGERLSLVSAEGDPILQVAFDDNGLWPKRADGIGGTLELTNARLVAASQVGKSYNWRGSSRFGGSPGSAGDPPRGVVINEVLTNPDRERGQVDAIELFNPTASDVDVGGWYLSDSSDDLLKYPIPAGTTIGAGQFLVFDQRQFNPQPNNPAPNHFGLSGTGGDDVWLVIADGQGGVAEFVDDVHFGGAIQGESLGRVPAGPNRLAPMSTVTLGETNAVPRVGPIVISEVNYSPGRPGDVARGIDSANQPEDLEFIEIFNPTNNTVDLSGWRLRGGVEFEFEPGTALASNTTLLVLRFDPASSDNFRRLTAFRSQYSLGSDVAVVGGYQGQLRDGGENVQLLRAARDTGDDGAIVYTLEDEVTYDNVSPWPQRADGAGQSLTRQAFDAWGNWPTSWRSAMPTPGAVETVFERIGDANRDGRFDRLDVNHILSTGKYRSGQPADWDDGDFTGDGVFDQRDIVWALQRGRFVDG